MFPLNIKNLLIVAAVSLSIGFGSGWHVHTKFVAADQLKKLQDQVDAYKAEQDIADAAAKAWEMSLAELREANKKLDRRLRNEIASNRVYSDCVVPASGVRALSDAITGSLGAGESGK